jgi:hypothetical protein
MHVARVAKAAKMDLSLSRPETGHPFSLIVVALCAMQNSSHLFATTDLRVLTGTLVGDARGSSSCEVKEPIPACAAR